MPIPRTSIRTSVLRAAIAITVVAASAVTQGALGVTVTSLGGLSSPGGLALTPDGATAVVLEQSNPGKIAIIDLTSSPHVISTELTDIDNPNDPSFPETLGGLNGVAITRTGNHAVITSGSTGYRLNLAANPPTVTKVGLSCNLNPSGVAVTQTGTQRIVVPQRWYGQWCAGLLDTSSPSIGINWYNDYFWVDPNPNRTNSLPTGVAIAPDGITTVITDPNLGYAYVVDPFSGGTPVVLAKIKVSNTPSPAAAMGVAITPDGSQALVPNPEDDAVSVIDLTANPPAKVASIPVGDNPDGIAITPDGAMALVVNRGLSNTPGTVSVIDLATHAVIDTIGVGTEPVAVAINPAGTHAFVTNRSDGTLSDIALVADRPGAPVITGTGGGDTAVTVSFTATANLDPITNYEYSLNGGAWVALSPADTTSPVTIPGLTNGTTYQLRIRAVNGHGTGAASDPTDVTAGPAAPTSLVPTRGDQQATISFTPGDAYGATVTNYQYSLDGGAWTNLAPTTTSSPVTIPGLTNGTTYAIRLRALVAGGHGIASAATTVTPAGTPGPPTAVVGTAWDGGVNLTWNAATGNGDAVTAYLVSSDGGATGYWFLPPYGTSIPAFVPGLTNGAPYTFVVWAWNGVGPGVPSDPVSVTPDGFPGQPSEPCGGDPTSTTGTATATVWFRAPDPRGTPVLNYEYQLCGGAWVPLDPPVTTPPITIRGLTVGATYSVRVRAVKAVGPGTASDPITVVGVAPVSTGNSPEAPSSGVPGTSGAGAPAATRTTASGTRTLTAGDVFAPNDDSLTPAVRREARRIAAAIGTARVRQITCIGHTDSLGPAEMNHWLGAARAKTMCNAIIAAGVHATRVVVASKGEAKPLVPNDTPAHRSRNRRIEVRVTR